MDRIIVQPGAIPLDTDLLNTNRNALLALSAIGMAAFGTNPVCDGLAVTQTTVPSMGVSVGPGTIFQISTLDTTAYGSLPISTSPCLKIGNNPTATTLSLTGLTGGIGSGQSQNFLVQAAFLEQDVNPVVLQYFNASNPSQPFSGPNNTGSANYTLRQEIVQLEIIPGAVATSGSQTTPAATSGWLPIAVITVPYGTTTIGAGNIAMFPSSFIGTKIPQLRTKLSSNLTLYVSTAANASDSNSGLTQNVPFATVQGAWNSLINSYDMNGYSVTISVGAGTYSSSVGVTCSGQPTGFGALNTVTIAGAGASTVISATGSNTAAIIAAAGANIILSNLTVQASGSASNGIAAYAGSTIQDNGIFYGACNYGHMMANGGFIYITGNSVISGNAGFHFGCEHGGQLVCSAGTTTFGNSAAYAFTEFSYAVTGIQDFGNGHTFSGCGSFTGSRYNVSYGGAIITGGSGSPTYFPGNASGTNNSGTAMGFYY